eukprot:CAMPEP_0184052674 /NCGR_PEP_ID=MMETSP0956-20121227/5453_1 /TAXON_ID=627963 /ORGANISM="Aplanochytrium sp, Strain PBS07" /LENGTH=606 /DNA_ID=CAMNT_0026345815 /DNA_START=45 /DNA_END=1864 /DNA_ORIENTATION=+
MAFEDAAHTLHSKYPRKTGVISLIFLIGNVASALQVFSHVGLSAVIKSSVDPNPIISACGTTCLDDPNYGDFVDYWSVNGSDGGNNYRFVLSGDDDFPGCGRIGALGGFGASFEDCLRENKTNKAENNKTVLGYTGPDSCMCCYESSIICGIVCGGSSVCGNDNTIPACIECIDREGCNDEFEVCSGLAIPPPDNSRRLAGNVDERRNLQEEELFIVYEISFISSIQDAINGEAYGIALVILLFSGVWPYAKNCIMFYAWFVPMTWSKRSWVLKTLTRLAKWSLVDVFAIVIIMAGLRIESDIVLIAESRIAIYTFCVAAVWDLIQGEWMRHMHLRAYERAIMGEEKGEDFSSAKLVDGGKLVNIPLATGSSDSMKSCTSFGKLSLLVFMVVQISLCVASVFLIVLTFTLSGSAVASGGEVVTELTPASIVTVILSPAALEQNDSVLGTIYLVIMYIALAILIPWFQFLAILVLTFVGWDSAYFTKSRYKTFFEATDIIGGFACQDVFVLSFVVVSAEWEKLIAASAEAIVGDCEDCFVQTAEIGIGIYIMTVAFVLGWISEMWISYGYSELLHPVERVWQAYSFFGAVSAYGCTKANDEEITLKN